MEIVAALAEKLAQSSENGDKNLSLLKDAVINCRQNEAYLRVVQVNDFVFVCITLQPGIMPHSLIGYAIAW